MLKKITIGLSIITLFVFIVIGALSGEQNSSLSAKEKTVLGLFSSWDGSNQYLVNHVKERMHNPDSFEHVETSHKVNGDSVMIMMKYRGKNGFNATVTNYQVGYYSIKYGRYGVEK